MRLLNTIICTLFSISIIAQTNSFDIKTISQIGLKVIDIHTLNNEEPICDFADAPEGCMGATAINATKVPCRIVILEGEKTLYDSGEYEKGVSGATIKINGNTTAYFSIEKNTPFKLKLQTKSDLLFRNDERFADKEWRLIKDATSMNTIVGLKLSQLMNFEWTPAYTPCNVFINDDYRGCYLLIESVKRNSGSRIDVNKNGYIIERDPYWWSENKYFTTNYFAGSKGYRWTWKYPDEDDVTAEQEAYISDYINAFEQSIKNDTYEQYIDVESFAKWVLANDILGMRDSGGTNIYVSKYDNTDNSVLKMTNLWDFDSSYQFSVGQFSRVHDAAYDFYFNDLFNSKNQTFKNVYVELWNQLSPTLLSDITNFINNYINSEEGKALYLSRIQHFRRWKEYEIETIKLEDNANKILNWFNQHIPLLDQRINTASNTISVYCSKKYTPLFNLFGQKINKTNKGIYICNGKKIIGK